MFAALVPLQPVRWVPDGLVCAPRASTDLPAMMAALQDCPVGWSPLDHVPAWPMPSALMMGGWYVRGPMHVPAPPGIRELIQTDGEGFGPHGHPSTAMCLRALDRFPDGPALDIGCGSGLLMQAWALLARGPVVGVDVDLRAVQQARASLALIDPPVDVDVVHGLLEQVLSDHSESVWLANLPLTGHRTVHACMAAHTAPSMMLCAGFRTAHRDRVLSGYRHHGLRPAGASRVGGWECWRLQR